MDATQATQEDATRRSGQGYSIEVPAMAMQKNLCDLGATGAEEGGPCEVASDQREAPVPSSVDRSGFVPGREGAAAGVPLRPQPETVPSFETDSDRGRGVLPGVHD